MKFVLCILISSIALISSAHAQPDGTPLLAEGRYITNGPSHYQDGTIEFTDWAEDKVMDAVLLRDGRAYEVTANLIRTTANRFDGSGFVTVRYDNGRVCEHRFGVIIFAYEDRIYLRENMPRVIPYSPGGACQGAGRYIWTDHEEPYYFDHELN